ncbi:MAG: benzoyl-CoA reductase subunit A [Planctomycetes bacterium]|nr:benzoyl-CoA reductase subunit A [Planctomycetota bacterium]
MKCYVGIDLGSTTTKAVVLDEQGAILGRGITNSRSNYDVACAVARGEAMTNVRFTLSARALPDVGLDAARSGPFLATLERFFRLAQYRAQMAVLREVATAEVPAVQSFFANAPLAPAIREILEVLDAGTEELFRPGAPRKSDFFRDLAGSQYHKEAQQRASPGKLPFEALMAVFDKAILKVENREIDLAFDQGAGWAIEQALVAEGLAADPAVPLLRAALRDAFGRALAVANASGTGYGRARLPFPKRQIRSEILCHGLGAHAMFPGTATVLDIGGQDTKAIQVDANGIVTSFQMNDRCAAGCGRYLGYIADEMSLGLHELGPLAQKATRPVKISSTCTVFAGAEIRDRLTLGQKREDILAGLHRAVILRAMSLIARSGGIKNEFTFTGGVAKNVTAVSVLRTLVKQNYGDVALNISPDSIFTGALGAALFALRAGADAAADPVEQKQEAGA